MSEKCLINSRKKTGYTKYDVVGMAIRSMYERVMQAKPEKQTKKPDQR
ncbi:hypothetical protein [Shimazuella kribbensis]|nr:hypothetical protein [Shimazuella kribbensis]